MSTPEKITEHTYGSHIFMRMVMPSGHMEEIDVYYQPDGSVKYYTTADKRSISERNEIIKAFNDLY